MIKSNTTFIKRNALRIRQNANAMDRLRKAREMDGSIIALKEEANKERISAYKEIIDNFAKNYNITNKDEAIGIVQRASKFTGTQARIFMKMVRGEPIHLANDVNNNVNNDMNK